MKPGGGFACVFLFFCLFSAGCAGIDGSANELKKTDAAPAGGEKSLPETAKLPVFIENEKVNKYLSAISKILAERSKDTVIAPVKILDTARVQAWPDAVKNEIIITGGMLGIMRNEAELACLISYETGMFSRARQKEKQKGKKTASGPAQGRAGPGSGEKKEMDAYAVKMAGKAGYDPFAYCDLLLRLEANIENDPYYRNLPAQGSVDPPKERERRLRESLLKQGIEPAKGKRKGKEYMEIFTPVCGTAAGNTGTAPAPPGGGFLEEDISAQKPFWPVAAGGARRVNADYSLLDGEFIDLYTGQKYLYSCDFKIKNAGYDLEFSRLYSSQAASEEAGGRKRLHDTGCIGTGWATNYDYNIFEFRDFIRAYHAVTGAMQDTGLAGRLPGIDIADAPGPLNGKKNYMVNGVPPADGLIMVFPGGGEITFMAKYTGNGKKTPAYSDEYTVQGRAWKAYKTGEGYRVCIEKKVYLFDASGRLSGITGRDGKGVKITRSGSAVEITDNYSRKLIISRGAGGFIESVSTNIEGLLPCAYVYKEADGMQYLKKTDRQGLEDAEYEYYTDKHHAGFLSRQKDLGKRGISKEVIYTAAYYGGATRYTEEKSADGRIISGYSYNNDNSVTVKDKGGERVFKFNEDGSLYCIDYGDDIREIIKYGPQGRISEKTLKNGSRESYYYDANGHITARTCLYTDPVNGAKSRTEVFKYDPAGSLLKYSDGGQNELDCFYDSAGRLVRFSDGSKSSEFSYNAAALVESVRDSGNSVKSFVYDSYGNLKTITGTAAGIDEEFSYDGAGRLKEWKGASGVPKKYEYDGRFQSRLKSIQSGRYGTIYYNYDGRGNLESVFDGMGNVNYSYDYDHINAIRDRAGLEKYYSYDGYGRVTAIRDNQQSQTMLVYGSQGLVKQVTDAFYRSAYYTRDGMGDIIFYKDRNGNEKEYKYDGLRQLRKIKNADGATVEYIYDGSGNVSAVIDEMGHAMVYEYDKNSRMLTKAFPDGSRVKYSYSSEGDPLKMQIFGSNGSIKKELVMAYDGAHRLLNDGVYTYSYNGGQEFPWPDKVSDALAPISGAKWSFEYDYKGRAIKTVYPGGTTVQDIYDDTGRKKTVMLNGEAVFELQLDGEGRSIYVIDKKGGHNSVFTISRGKDGRITGITYPNGCSSSTAYDNEGRVLSHSNYSGKRCLSSFDMSGPAGYDDEGNVLLNHSYSYDAQNRLIYNNSFTWAYDAAGNRIFSREGNEKIYRVNDANQYVSAGNRDYYYDALGNPVDWTQTGGLVELDGAWHHYAYENLRSSLNADFYYDGGLPLADGNGKIFINDGQGILGAIENYGNKRTYFLFDPCGSVSECTDESGHVLQAYAYTPFGVQLTANAGDNNNLKFRGRYGAYTSGGTVFYKNRRYDPGLGRWMDRPDAGPGKGLDSFIFENNNPMQAMNLRVREDIADIAKAPEADYISADKENIFLPGVELQEIYGQGAPGVSAGVSAEAGFHLYPDIPGEPPGTW